VTNLLVQYMFVVQRGPGCRISDVCRVYFIIYFYI